MRRIALLALVILFLSFDGCAVERSAIEMGGSVHPNSDRIDHLEPEVHVTFRIDVTSR